MSEGNFTSAAMSREETASGALRGEEAAALAELREKEEQEKIKNMTPEEKDKYEQEKEAKEAKEEQERKEQEAAAQEEPEMTEKEAEAAQKKAEEAEAKRIEELQKTYILHSAMITCSYARRASRVVIPTSHGEYICGIDQLNVGDSKAIENIQSFGVCTSPENPSVIAAAKENMKKAQEEAKKNEGFLDKVMNFFCGGPDEDAEPGADIISQSAGDCTPVIAMEWLDGKEDTLVDGKPALLGRCKLTCLYHGEIEIYTDGICQEMLNQVEGNSETEP